MTVESRFDTGDMVYVLYKNDILRVKVESIEFIAYEDKTTLIRYRVRPAGSMEAIEFLEKRVFASTEELVSNLLNRVRK